MYNASSAFHTAVANSAHQIALLVFPDAIFSNEDIDVDRGIEFNDYFNTEEDISIGQALSNELQFSLFNDKRLLNSYEFGEFQATIGAQIGNVSDEFTGNCKIVNGDDVLIGKSSSPYLTRNGAGITGGPTEAVIAMLIRDGKLYCFGENGYCKVFNAETLAEISENPSTFMLDKADRDLRGQGWRYVAEDRSLEIWKDGRKLTYEFVPLGTFIADRPNAPDNIEIDFHCNDIMMKFKDDMPDTSELGITYPVTFKALLQALCTKAGVPYGAGSSFINSSATLNKKPEEFDNCTMRDVVAWIAEAACANARISRDGKLVLSWLKTTSQTLDETKYVDFQPYWYETQRVTKLHNRTTQNNTEHTAGSGSVGYLIQDNPLLKGAS